MSSQEKESLISLHDFCSIKSKTKCQCLKIAEPAQCIYGSTFGDVYKDGDLYVLDFAEEKHHLVKSLDFTRTGALAVNKSNGLYGIGYKLGEQNSEYYLLKYNLTNGEIEDQIKINTVDQYGRNRIDLIHDMSFHPVTDKLYLTASTVVDGRNNTSTLTRAQIERQIYPNLIDKSLIYKNTNSNTSYLSRNINLARSRSSTNTRGISRAGGEPHVILCAFNPDPNLDIPDDVIECENDPGECGATIEYELVLPLGSTGLQRLDANDIPTTGPNFYDIGTTTLIFTYRVDNPNNPDGQLDRSYCRVDITVTDTEAPLIIAEETLTIECGDPVPQLVRVFSPNMPTKPGEYLITDNCTMEDQILVEISGAIGPATCAGNQLIRTITATDEFNNVGVFNQLITFIDTKPPVFSGGQSGTISVDSCDDIPPRQDPVVTDICTSPEDILLIYDQEIIEELVGFKVVRTWTATDACNNTSTQQYTISVNDTIPPFFLNCPSSMTVPNDPGECTAVVTYEFPTAADDCDCTSQALSLWYTQNDLLSDQAQLEVEFLEYSFQLTADTLESGTISLFVQGSTGATGSSGDKLPATEWISIGFPVDEFFSVPELNGMTLIRYRIDFIYNGPDVPEVDELQILIAYIDRPVNNQEIYTEDFSTTNFKDNDQTTAIWIAEPEQPPIALPSGKVTAKATVCGPVFIEQTAGLPSGAVYPLGVTENIFLATDNSGNTTTCRFTVTVFDNEPPIVSCKDKLTVYLDENSTAIITEEDLEVTANDNCDGELVSISIEPMFLTCENVGIQEVVVSAVDSAGNTGTCVSMVTVYPFQVFICPADEIVFNDVGACTAVVTYDYPILTDLCQLGQTGQPEPPLEPGITGATGATGPTGNTGPGVPGENATIVQIEGLPSGSEFPIGITTNVFYASDPVTGFTGTCSFTITVFDTEPPIINCPANIVKNTDPGQCTAVVFYDFPTASDACGETEVSVVQTGGLPSGSAFPLGTTFNTFLATSFAGNINSCLFSVTVVDKENPTLTCQDLTIELDETGAASITLEDLQVRAADNCGLVSVTLSKNSFTCEDLGENQVVVTAVDTGGNQAVCASTVTVIDRIPPIVRTKNLTFTVTGETGTFKITPEDINDGSTDNCGIQSMRVSPDTLNCRDHVGENRVKLIVTDTSGNVSTGTSIVTILDNIAPVFLNCPKDIITNNNPGKCTAMVTYPELVAVDNCTRTERLRVEQITGQLSGSNFPVGITKNTFIAVDESGNTGTCSFTVTVVDMEPPTNVSRPANIYETADPGKCTKEIYYPIPEFTDNCPGILVEQTGGFISGSKFPIGTTTNTFLAIDAASNRATTSFTVTVFEHELTDNQVKLWELDVKTGNLLEKGQLGYNTSGNALAFSKKDNKLYQVYTTETGEIKFNIDINPETAVPKLTEDLCFTCFDDEQTEINDFRVIRGMDYDTILGQMVVTINDRKGRPDSCVEDSLGIYQLGYINVCHRSISRIAGGPTGIDGIASVLKTSCEQQELLEVRSKVSNKVEADEDDLCQLKKRDISKIKVGIFCHNVCVEPGSQYCLSVVGFAPEAQVHVRVTCPSGSLFPCSNRNVYLPKRNGASHLYFKPKSCTVNVELFFEDAEAGSQFYVQSISLVQYDRPDFCLGPDPCDTQECPDLYRSSKLYQEGYQIKNLDYSDKSGKQSKKNKKSKLDMDIENAILEFKRRKYGDKSIEPQQKGYETNDYDSEDDNSINENNKGDHMPTGNRYIDDRDINDDTHDNHHKQSQIQVNKLKKTRVLKKDGLYRQQQQLEQIELEREFGMDRSLDNTFSRKSALRNYLQNTKSSPGINVGTSVTKYRRMGNLGVVPVRKEGVEQFRSPIQQVRVQNGNKSKTMEIVLKTKNRSFHDSYLTGISNMSKLIIVSCRINNIQLYFKNKMAFNDIILNDMIQTYISHKLSKDQLLKVVISEEDNSIQYYFLVDQEKLVLWDHQLDIHQSKETTAKTYALKYNLQQKVLIMTSNIMDQIKKQIGSHVDRKLLLKYDQNYVTVNTAMSYGNQIKLIPRMSEPFALDELQMSQRCDLIWSNETSSLDIAPNKDKLMLGQYKLNKKLSNHFGAKVTDITLMHL